MTSPLDTSTVVTTTQQQEHFDDAIHGLVNAIRRPGKKEQADLAPLKGLLEHLVQLCGNDTARWKTLVLALTYKRYHLLSPQAKQENSSTTGDGERLIFYTAVSVLFDHVQQSDSNMQARLALHCLVRIAPLAGGSRDVCTILVDMVTSLLVQVRMDSEASLSTLVRYGIRMIQDEQDESCLESFQYLLQLAADTLDRDMKLIRNFGDEKELPSTLHVFLPHRDRGRPKKKKNVVSERQVVNSVVEILLWSHTTCATNNKTFVACYESFLNDDKTTTKSNLHILQMIIRNLRKELNGFARNQGFMLTDQFQLKNSDSLTLEQVSRGKAGDLMNLTRLASKTKDDKVLQLIAARRTQFGKQDKYSSVNELVMFATSSSGSESQREAHVNRVKGSLQFLRGLVESKHDDKSVVIVSMENNAQSNHVTAILMAAAMSKWDVSSEETTASEMAASDVAMETEEEKLSGKVVKLFIGGVEKEMTCFQDFLALLDNAALGLCKSEVDAPSLMDEDGMATTKAVINTIDRHLGDSEAMLLITSGDIRLPADVMKAMTARGCTLHCHDSDNIGERLLREAAQKGDITISLAWDTTDDLDLHVILPSGEEIDFGNKVSRNSPCMLDVDMNVGGGSKEPVENVFAGDLDKMIQAPCGPYKVIVQNYAYHEPGSSDTKPAVPFRLVVEKNGVKEKFEGQCQGTGKGSNVTVHEFNYEGRTVPFPDEVKYVTAFSTSNMVNVTASTGQTMESLGQLVKTVQDLEHLDMVRMLVDEDVDKDEEEEDASVRPLMAEHGTLEVTSRDRLNMLLAGLPNRFHVIVGEAFGGPSLVETCAKDISRRMVADRIPISELKRNGYPDDVVEAVKAEMGKTGLV